MQPIPLTTLTLQYERDVVLARQRARQIAAHLGFESLEQTRLATAVSELARNAFEYAGGGRVEFRVADIDDTPALFVRVADDGPGIANLEDILGGRYVSPTGMGLGIVGARRLTDWFAVDSARGEGTRVEIAKRLPGHGRADAVSARAIADALARERPQDPVEEIREQNLELVRTLEALRARQSEVERLNAELAETNRGVLALYAELDDRAEDLRRLSELKSRFLSDVGHELRTPLASMANLATLLVERTDGDLTSEQERQATLIKRSAETAIDLVNDLLDLAKIEAGRIEIRPSEFTVTELFAGLRGMLRPLLSTDAVALVFEDQGDVPPLYTDEQRLAQVLRNFLSNAIKFTERGEIRTRVRRQGELVRFEVADTGIGIAPADHERVFEEFTQIEGAVQRKRKGTGLGLPLTRRLATLLGGSVEMTSALGVGSVFSLTIPRVHPGAEEVGTGIGTKERRRDG